MWSSRKRLFSSIAGGPGYLHVFAVALLFRLAYLAQAWNGNALLDVPLVDARTYFEWAQRIMSGQLLWAEVPIYTPTYPIFLATCLGLLGGSIKLAFICFHLLGAINALLIGKIAEKIWNRRTGLIAGFIAALYWPLIIFEATFHAESLAIWTLCAGFLCFLEYKDTARLQFLLLSGFCLAVSALCRPNMLLVMILLCPLIAGPRTGKPLVTLFTKAGRCALFLLPLVLLAAPILFWNFMLSGKLTLRAISAVNLYLGNNPEFDGLIVLPGVQWDHLMTLPYRLKPGMTSADDSVWIDESLRIMREDTGSWLLLQGRKLLMFLNGYEVSQEFNLYRYRSFSRLLKLPVWPGFRFVMPLAWVGIFFTARQRRRLAGSLLVLLAAGLLSIFPFHVAARYRLLLAPALIVLAAVGIAKLWLSFKQQRFPALLISGSLILGAILVCFPDYTKLRKRNAVRYSYHLGCKEHELGNSQKAIAFFEQASLEIQADPDAPLQMANIYLELGEYELAKRYFARSRTRFQDNPEAMIGAAAVAYNKGDTGLAFALINQCISQWPARDTPLPLLKRMLQETGNLKTLVPVLESMMRSRYSPELEFELAAVYVRAKNWKDALGIYERISNDRRFSHEWQDRATFLAGAILINYETAPTRAQDMWQTASGHNDSFFGTLCAFLVGKIDQRSMRRTLSSSEFNNRVAFMLYTEALAAELAGKENGAIKLYKEIVKLPNVTDRSLPEYWALQRVERK